MKTNRSAWLVVAMMCGSLLATGCNKGSDASAPEDVSAAAAESPTAAPEAPAATAAPEQVNAQASAAAQIPAPPALQVESRGKAPSGKHAWQRGYWRYERAHTKYVWVPGYWLDQSAFAPFAPPPSRVEDRSRAPRGDYYYVAGYWRWTGRTYTWMSGRWEARRDGRTIERPRYERENGRWVYRVERVTAPPRAHRHGDGHHHGHRPSPQVGRVQVIETRGAVAVQTHPRHG